MRLMTASEKAYKLIKDSEGLELASYKCPAGKWTIGYGHTKFVAAGMSITMEIAEELLREDVQECEKVLNRMGVNFRQGQFDALVSFIFNFGEGKFNSSSLKKKILAGAPDEEIVAELKKWDKATVNGKKVPLGGLTKSRAAETALWMEES